MSRPFIHEDFLLESDVARELYHVHAASLPIIDYHGHLSPEQMAKDAPFPSITELWLGADHYKWRAMRTNGVAERLCTGDAPDFERFEAWARTVPMTLGNPLHHWTQMELLNPFGITELLDGASARSIFDRCNEQLASGRLTPLTLLERFKVAVVCTTDDPADSLEFHAELARRDDPTTVVCPTWRPDRALAVHDPEAFGAWLSRLEMATGMSITRLADLQDALDRRRQAFADVGCRASDHGLETVDFPPATEPEATLTFDRARAGKAPSDEECARYRSFLLLHDARLAHARGWVQQFHIGALRNTNTRMLRLLGPDAGFDSIHDREIARPLSRFLDQLDLDGRLAKTVLFNSNPRDNALIASMIGNFQDGSVPGKLQFGPAWWFLDQRDGMEAQLRALASTGLLSRFIGMTTDSRSFLSFPRHDYFRRVLCNLFGEDVSRGLLPDDRKWLGDIVRAIGFDNARDYFGLPLGRAATTLPPDKRGS